MIERECKFFKCFKYKNKKLVQWWSFHELNLDEIMQEISLYISINRKDGLEFIMLNGKERMFKEEIKGKNSKTIIKKIEEYYKNNDFQYIYIDFKNCYMEMCKGEPDSYWRR